MNPPLASVTPAPSRVRQRCRRCTRPLSACWCADLSQLPSRTRVVFLQHPREARVAVGTCRMAHLALPNSALYQGTIFDTEPALEPILSAPDSALLFPGPGACALDELPVPPRTLVVIDGTWPEARKVLRRNPRLARLRRIGFTPAEPTAYRIRREPAAHCVSTIEAVAHVLGRLEGDAGRFRALLAPFHRMVAHQVACADTYGTPWRHTRRHGQPRRLCSTQQTLRRQWESLVALAAEGLPGAGGDILLRLVAYRMGDDQHLDLLVESNGVSPRTADHTGLSLTQLACGESLAVVRERWAAFVRPTDLLVEWGAYATALLRPIDGCPRPKLDLRPACGRWLNGRPGGVERAAMQLAGPEPLSPVVAGRAGRRVAAVVRVARALADGNEAQAVAPIVADHVS